jgi:hypothetical protein
VQARIDAALADDIDRAADRADGVNIHATKSESCGQRSSKGSRRTWVRLQPEIWPQPANTARHYVQEVN